jgi:hypothetical protein
MRNSPQYVDGANPEDEDGPELRDVSTDQAEDGDNEEDESQHHGQCRVMKGPGDAREEDRFSGAFLRVSRASVPQCSAFRSRSHFDGHLGAVGTGCPRIVPGQRSIHSWLYARAHGAHRRLR